MNFIPQWEVDNGKLLPLIYLLVSPHASAILQGGIFVFLAVGKSDSTLPNVWTSARRWPTRASPSTSPSRWVQLSPSPLRQRTRVWPRTAQARPRRRQARLPLGEMPGARRPSWKKRQNPVPDPVSTEGGVEPGVGPWDCQSREKTLPSVTFVETVSNLKLVWRYTRGKLTKIKR